MCTNMYQNILNFKLVPTKFENCDGEQNESDRKDVNSRFYTKILPKYCKFEILWLNIGIC